MDDDDAFSQLEARRFELPVECFLQLSDIIGKHTDVTVGQVFRRMDRYLATTVPAMRKQLKNLRSAVRDLPDDATAEEVKRIVQRGLDGLENRLAADEAEGDVA